MKPFFQVQTIEQVWGRMSGVGCLPPEAVPLEDAAGRTLAEDFTAPHDLPGFARSTMDGYAVRARDTFGASETQPGYLSLVGEVVMGSVPDVSVDAGQCAKIGTGGMLPEGADAVVMIEHTREADGQTVEINRSVAPGANVIGPTDDAVAGQVLLPAGRELWPQDVGRASCGGPASASCPPATRSFRWTASRGRGRSATSTPTCSPPRSGRLGARPFPWGSSPMIRVACAPRSLGASRRPT